MSFSINRELRIKRIQKLRIDIASHQFFEHLIGIRSVTIKFH